MLIFTDAHENHAQVPNGFGCGLGAIQLILYAIYRDNKNESKKLDPKLLEMGQSEPKAQPNEKKQSITQLHENGHV